MKVTIKCERADGQFALAVTDVPDDLLYADISQQDAAEEKIKGGFVDTYRRAAELPR
jgi:hypothetical protein